MKLGLGTGLDKNVRKALSGGVVIPAPSQSISNNITETTFDVNWAAVIGVGGYRVDVAWDAAFTQFLPGYNNKDVGNVLTTTIDKYDPDASVFILAQEGAGDVFNDTQKNLISRLYREIKGEGVINNSENLLSVTDVSTSSNIVSIAANGGATGPQAALITAIQDWWEVYWGISWIGDSIIYLWEADSAYSQVINGTHIYPIQNLGIPDSTIARVDVGDSTFSMCNRYTDVATGKGIIILSGGENDYRYQIPIGSPTSTDEYEFNGGLNKIIEGLKASYPDARIILTTPIERSDYPYAIPFTDYVDAIMERANAHGLECWDMYRRSRITQQSAQAGIDTIDGIHPSPAGYNKMGNIISRFFNNTPVNYYIRVRAYQGANTSANSNTIANDGQAMNHFVFVDKDGGTITWDTINEYIKGSKLDLETEDYFEKVFGFTNPQITGYTESSGNFVKIYDMNTAITRNFVTNAPAYSVDSGVVIATYSINDGINTVFSDTYFTGTGMPMTLIVQCKDIDTPAFGAPSMLASSLSTVPFVTAGVLNTTPQNTEYAYRTDGSVFVDRYYETDDQTVYNIYAMSLRLEQNAYLNGELKNTVNTGALTFSLNQVRTATGNPTDVFGGVMLSEQFLLVEATAEQILNISNRLATYEP